MSKRRFPFLGRRNIAARGGASGAAPLVPAIADLQNWWKPENLVVGASALWTDAGSEGADLIKGFATDPANAVPINGQQTMFGSSSNAMQNVATTISGARETWLVCRTNLHSNNHFIFDALSGGASGDRCTLYIDSTGDINANAGSTLTQSAEMTEHRASLLRIRQNGDGSGDIFVVEDTGSSLTTPLQSGTMGSNDMVGFTLAANNTGSSGFKGGIAECMRYDALLSPGDAVLTAAYLLDKYPVCARRSLTEVSTVLCGDSLTQGFGTTDGYGFRAKILAAFEAVDVASGTLVLRGPFDERCLDHAGNTGDTIADLTARVVTAMQDPPAGVPDVMTIIIGTNDCQEVGYDGAVALADYQALFSAIATEDATVPLVVATVPPLSNVTHNGNVDDANLQLAIAISGAGNPIVSVDMGILLADLQGDGVHLDEAANVKAATILEAGIRSALNGEGVIGVPEPSTVNLKNWWKPEDMVVGASASWPSTGAEVATLVQGYASNPEHGTAIDGTATTFGNLSNGWEELTTTMTGARDIWLVVRPDDMTGNQFMYDGVTGSDRMTLFSDGTQDFNSNAGSTLVASGLLKEHRVHILRIRVNGDNSGDLFIVTDAATAQTPVSSGTIGNNDWVGISLCAANTGSSGWKGDLTSLLRYDALQTTPEVLLTADHLLTKYPSAAKLTWIDDSLLCVGDSILLGNESSDVRGVRSLLRVAFEATDLEADTRTLTFRGPILDRCMDHAAESGDIISDITARVATDMAAGPRVMVLLAGTNDCRNNGTTYDGVTTPAAFATLLATIAVENPGMPIVVCNLPPLANTGHNTNVDDFNSKLPAVIASATNPIISVDLNSAITDPDDLAADGIHPNDGGYAIASALIEAGIRAALPNGYIVDGGSNPVYDSDGNYTFLVGFSSGFSSGFKAGIR